MLAMQQEAAMDDAGDGPIRRAIPAFPWNRLRRALTLSDGYSADTTLKPVPIGTRNLTGIRWGAIFESAEYGPAALCVQRAFGESRTRHNLQPVHMSVMLYCELGIVGRPDPKGRSRWCIYNPGRPNAVMPYEEAGRLLGIRADLVERYHRDVKRAIEDEWQWYYSGYEG
jgi:hypothetical protein